MHAQGCALRDDHASPDARLTSTITAAGRGLVPRASRPLSAAVRLIPRYSLLSLVYSMTTFNTSKCIGALTDPLFITGVYVMGVISEDKLSFVLLPDYSSPADSLFLQSVKLTGRCFYPNSSKTIACC
jgi:hypothetical protein